MNEYIFNYLLQILLFHHFCDDAIIIIADIKNLQYFSQV